MRTVIAGIGLLIIAGLNFGCEEDVVSVLGTDRPYTLYGVFSPQLDTQWVRVFPIDDILELESPDPLDAVFTTLNRSSGLRRTWQDSIIQESNGQFAHVFWSPFVAEYGHEYEVSIQRSDGATTHVLAAVPQFAELELREPILAPAAHPVFVNAPVPRLFDIIVTYTISYRLPGTPIIRSRFPIDYSTFERLQDGGWEIRIQLWQDFAFIRNTLIEDLALSLTEEITLEDLEIDLVIASADWDPPGGVFDAEVLVQPGLFSNVENGFGFVGAGYRRNLDWLPPDEVIQSAGFALPSDMMPGPMEAKFHTPELR